MRIFLEISFHVDVFLAAEYLRKFSDFPVYGDNGNSDFCKIHTATLVT